MYLVGCGGKVAGRESTGPCPECLGLRDHQVLEL